MLQDQVAVSPRPAGKDPMMSYTVRPLGASTWDAFAELVERNNGVFGGCWCMGFHPEVSR